MLGEEDGQHVIIHCDQCFKAPPPHSLLVDGKANPDDLPVPGGEIGTILNVNPPMVQVQPLEAISNEDKQTFKSVKFLLKVSEKLQARLYLP